MNHARLLKLADDLDHLPLEWKWDYDDVDHCAFARCNILFPDLIDEDTAVTLDLSDEQVTHLFWSGCQESDIYGGKVLDADAPASAVAANIRAMVERDKEKKNV